MFVRLLMAQALVVCGASAYSVLTHEALVDAAWENGIKPVLLKRFPNATPDELRKAHAHAYGGAIIQDLGYYPMGSHFFSDLVHYARSGDFVVALLSEARDLNEFAFALGALAHDAADRQGHAIGVNPAVPLIYPKVKARFGKVATYADDPASHLKAEFGFDVVQVAHGNYAPESYRDFIGFEVSKPVLERAFHKTYGVELGDVFLSVDLAIGTYRWTVSQLIPQMTKVAWDLRKNDIARPLDGLTRDKFVYTLSRASFEKEWGKEYKRPGWFARFLSFLFRLIPRIGPFRALAFKAPGPEAQKLFMASFNAALDTYRIHLETLRSGSPLRIANRNLDTGEPIRAGRYSLADETWIDLVEKLSKRRDEPIDSELRTEISRFYATGVPEDAEAAAALRVLLGR